MRLFFSLIIACVFVVSARADEVKPLEIGAVAPAFSLPGVDGKTYTLENFKDAKVLVVVFTCNHCPTAQMYAPRIQKLYDEYKDRGVGLVAINPNDPLAIRLDELGYTEYGDSFDEMKLRAKEINVTYPYLYDGDKQEAAHAYGPVATPVVYIFDQARKLRYRGHVDDGERGNDVTSEDARNAIEALLAGKPVTNETTPSLGCSTKWSEKRKSVTEQTAAWEKEPVTLGEADAKAISEILKNDTKKVRLVNFFATWCPPCVAEFPDVVDLSRQFATRDFELIFMSLDAPETKAKALDFLQKHHASTKNYLVTEMDGNKLTAAVDNKWEGEIPLTLLIAPGGKVISKAIGTIDPIEVKKAILQQLGRKQ